VAGVEEEMKERESYFDREPSGAKDVGEFNTEEEEGRKNVSLHGLRRYQTQSHHLKGPARGRKQRQTCFVAKGGGTQPVGTSRYTPLIA
jgi:hypothetical protein